MKRKLIPAIAAGALLVGGLGTYGVSQAMASDVVISVDGQKSEVKTLALTVGQVLAQNRIDVGEHDTVVPSLESKVTKGSEISVRYGRPITLTLDGKQTTMWTTATTVDEALGLFGIDSGAKLSTSRSTTISRDGMSVDATSPRNVTITADGATKAVSATGTVVEALTAAGITLSTHDEVTPDLFAALSDNVAITVVRVELRTVSKTVAIPYASTTKDDASLSAGTKKVETPGVEGTSTETWQQTLRDGQVANEVRIASVVTTPAQDQVTLVGTKVAAAKAASSSTSSSTSSSAASTQADNSDLTPATGNSCGVSWYASGSRTANGEAFNPDDITAAHKTLPFNTMVKVTNPANGKSVIVRITDRGPFIAGRCLDLSRGAFSQIASLGTGAIKATWEVVG